MKTNSQSKAEEGKGVEEQIKNILKHFRSSAKDCYQYKNISVQCLLRMGKEAKFQCLRICKSYYKTEALREAEEAVLKRYDCLRTDEIGDSQLIREVFAKLREGL